MSRKIYIGTGTSRKIRQLYIGSGNMARRIKAAYVGVSGTSKKVWPMLYVWNRYTINSNVWYEEYISSEKNVTIRNKARVHRRISSYNYISTSGAFGLFNYTASGYEYISDLPNGTTIYCGYSGDIFISNNTVSFIDCNETGSFVQLHDFYKLNSSTLRYRIHDSQRKSSASIGSYVDQVFSENRSAYPDNGQFGSYWYVYQGEA